VDATMAKMVISWGADRAALVNGGRATAGIPSKSFRHCRKNWKYIEKTGALRYDTLLISITTAFIQKTN
jgi:hypothetical protein